MSAAVDITEQIAVAAARSWLLSVLPSGIEVVRGQDNAVGEPTGPDWLAITPLLRRRLGTNVEAYQDLPSASYRFVCTPTEYRLQVDVYGPNSSDNAQIISSLWRDRNATDFFGTQTISAILTADGDPLVTQTGLNLSITSALNATPLYADDPRQLEFINAAQAYEKRWSVDLLLQINPTIQIAQQFAASLTIGLISVDVTYPPS